LKTYDKIYTIDLHGNSKKKETAPDGSLQTQMCLIFSKEYAINIFVKTGKKKNNELGKVFHFDLFGKREVKYDFLTKNSLNSISYNELPNVAPNYFFIGKDFEEQKGYEKGFSVSEIFLINGVGVTTAHDEFVINDSKRELLSRFMDFRNTERNADLLHSKFNVKRKEGWNILQGFDNIKNELDLEKYIQPISYRPFDNKYIFYEDKLVWRTVRKVMQHFKDGDNIGIVFGRQSTDDYWCNVQVSKSMIDNRYHFSYKGTASQFPIYLYPPTIGQQTIDQTVRRIPNLNLEIVDRIAKDLNLWFAPERPDYNVQTEETNMFYPIDILDYIYAVLHSPTYREKYKEF
jgi:predicted helicase